MKLKEINTDHYVVVDDSEIKEGDWYYHLIRKTIHNTSEKADYFVNNTKYNDFKKITHSNQPLNTIILKNRNHSQSVGHYYGDGGQLSLQEVKELIGEVDVDKRIYDTDFRGDVNSYKQGYNQALEDNKDKKYTLEDMKYMFQCGRNYQNNAEITFKVSMEYLQPKTQWEVEFDENGKLKLKQ